MTGPIRPPVPDSHRQGATSSAPTTVAGHHPRPAAVVISLDAYRRRKHLRLAWSAPDGPMAA